jgi:hypothetical protein
VVSVTRPGFDFKLVSVIVPPDSGRRVTVVLPPQRRRTAEEAHNLDDFEQRQSWRSNVRSLMYTRAQLEQMEIEWVYDALHRGITALGNPLKEPPSKDCVLIANGGPQTVEVGPLLVDEIEALEIYVGPQSPPPAAFRGTPAPAGSLRNSVPGVATSNTRLATHRNAARACVLAYVWLR